MWLHSWAKLYCGHIYELRILTQQKHFHGEIHKERILLWSHSWKRITATAVECLVMVVKVWEESNYSKVGAPIRWLELEFVTSKAERRTWRGNMLDGGVFSQFLWYGCLLSLRERKRDVDDQFRISPSFFLLSRSSSVSITYMMSLSI